jgi:hypothetical protein
MIRQCGQIDNVIAPLDLLSPAPLPALQGVRSPIMRHRGTRRNQRRVSSSPTLVERTLSQDARRPRATDLPPPLANGTRKQRHVGRGLARPASGGSRPGSAERWLSQEAVTSVERLCQTVSGTSSNAARIFARESPASFWLLLTSTGVAARRTRSAIEWPRPNLTVASGRCCHRGRIAAFTQTSITQSPKAGPA